MKTIYFKETSAQLAHIAELNTSIILMVELPSGFEFLKHAELPVVEASDKDICIIQKVLRDNENLNFKLKLNTMPGRTDITLKGKAIIQSDADYIADFSVVLPVLITNSGASEAISKAVIMID